MHAVGLVLSRAGSQVMWQVGSRGHVRYMMGIVVGEECVEIGNLGVSLDHCCCI